MTLRGLSGCALILFCNLGLCAFPAVGGESLNVVLTSLACCKKEAAGKTLC